MKKYLTFVLTIVVLSTNSSCSKDDDNSSTPTIVGKWRAEKYDYYINGQFEETEIIVEDNSDCPDYIEFKSNDTYVSIENDTSCNQTVDESGTYTYNGTTITYNSNSSTTVLTIISLTSSDLKFDLTETSLDGITFKTVGYLKKIN